MVRRRRKIGANARAAAEIAAWENRLAIRHYKETSVLKPVSPSVHSDNWPCFLLTDATVHVPNGEMVSQLDVDLFGPLIIRGKLELEKDNERYLVNRHMKGRALRIQIQASRAFSVGAKDDSLSVPVVWASGEAGWFEIVPAPCYQRICDEMFQAVSLHYSLLDQFEEALEKLQKLKKKKKATMADVPLDLDEMLFQYALRAGDGLTLSEAHQRFNRNNVFLLSHFPKDTSLYKHLAEKYSSTVKLLADKDRKPRDPSFNICRLAAYDYPLREKSSSLEVTDGKKKGRGRVRNSASRATRTSEVSDVEISNPPNKTRENHRSRSARAKKRSPAGPSPEDDDVIMIDPPKYSVARSKTSRNHKEVNENNPAADLNATGGTKSSVNVLVDALQDVREQILQQISEGKQKKQLNQITAKTWCTKVYMECNIKHYNSVEEIFHYHARHLVHHLGPEWHDTLIYQWAKEKASIPAILTLISEEEVNQIVRRVKKSARGNHIEKAVKENPRPEVREYAGKQTPKSRPSGKAAGLRPSTGGKKRLRYEIDFEDSMDIDEDGSLKKKSKKSHFFTEDEDEDEDDEQDDDESADEDDGASSHESKSYAENNDVPITQLVIRAEKLPSTEPKGPNQTWICEEPDCGYIVRAAHEEQGRTLISAHYEEHEKEAQDVAQEMALNRVNLAVQEARGHMPINHLLEKIRNIGEKSSRRDEVHLNGHVVPEPIKRTLLI